MIDTTKIELSSKSIDKLVEIISNPRTETYPWLTYGLPILTIAFGAGLTLLIQWLIEGKKNRRADEVIKRQLLAKAKAKIFFISRLLSSLAMYRVHKQYYYRLAEVITEKEKSDLCWNRHYEKGQETRETESKFYSANSEYIEVIIEYLHLSESKKDIEPELKIINEYNFEKASNFEECKSTSECVAEMRIDEDRLRIEYKKYLLTLNNLLNKASS